MRWSGETYDRQSHVQVVYGFNATRGAMRAVSRLEKRCTAGDWDARDSQGSLLLLLLLLLLLELLLALLLALLLEFLLLRGCLKLLFPGVLPSLRRSADIFHMREYHIHVISYPLVNIQKTSKSYEKSSSLI